MSHVRASAADVARSCSPGHPERFAVCAGDLPVSPARWNGLNQGIEVRNVVAACAGQDDRERDILRVDDEVVLAAELAPVCGIRAGFFPPAWRELTNCRRWHALNRFRRGGAVRPAAFRGCVARLRPSAIRQAVAGRLCLSHNPFPAAAGFTQCPSAVEHDASQHFSVRRRFAARILAIARCLPGHKRFDD